MKILSAIALFVLWLVLSASYELMHVTMGAVAAAFVAWISPVSSTGTKRFSLIAAVMYVPWLFVRVMKSGFHVSKLILQPSLPIKPELIHHNTELKSDGELAVLGNSITLTPGTITVEVAPGQLIVHAIDTYSQQDLASGALDEKVSRLFSAKESGQ